MTTQHRALTPGNPDLYLDWLRTTRPHPPREQEQAERAAEELMTWIRQVWLPKDKPIETHQTSYFAELDARAAELPPSHLPWLWDNVSHLLRGWVSTGAYRRARQAEADHGLPVDVDYLVENALVLTRHCGLKGPEQSRHLCWLREHLPAERAHRETARFLTETAAHNHHAPPENLCELVHASASAAGHGPEEEARLLGEVLKGECARWTSEQLLGKIAQVFAKARPDATVRRALLEVYPHPQARTTGKGLLKVLRHSGAFDDMVSGRLRPEAGPGGWLTGFVDSYTYTWNARAALTFLFLPSDLYPMLEKLAGPLVAEGTPVRIHYRDEVRACLDGRLADTCLRLGIPVVDPGPGVMLALPPRRRDDYAHLRQDPVLGPRVAHLTFTPNMRARLA